MAEGRHRWDDTVPKVCHTTEAAEGEDETVVHGINIDCLPDEVMINIFSSVSFNDLFDGVQNVCTRWRRLAHDPVLWVNKEYIITGRLYREIICHGVDASKCGHCRRVETDVEVLREAGSMPQLRTLKLMRRIGAPILREICANCPNLTNLRIDGSPERDDSLMEYIFEKCPKIQKLSMGESMMADQRCVDIVSTLKHLRSLEAYEDYWYIRPVEMSALAHVLPQLEEISFDWPRYETDDMEYFLKAKKHSLISVNMPWRLVGRPRCIVQLLKQCNIPVRKLGLKDYDVLPEDEAEVFKALGELHSLRELCAPEIQDCQQPALLSIPFQPGCLTQLERLQLPCSVLLDETVVTISRNCPNLRELVLGGTRITDIALSEIHRLKHLEILEITSCNRLGGAAMAHIAQLPALHTLFLNNMSDLYKLQPGLQHILDMKELWCLDITHSSNIEALPFDEFPKRLVKLRKLHVAEVGENVFAELQREMPLLKILALPDCQDDI